MMDVDEQDEEATEWDVRGAWRLVNDVLAFGVPAVLPDADLITACSEYLRIQRAFEAYYITLDGDMEDNDPHWGILKPLPGLRDKIATLRATTAEGYYARARCVAFHYMPEYKGCLDHSDGAAEDRFKAANLRDMVREERGTAGAHAVRPYISPDAELLETCAAFDVLERAYIAASGERLPGSDVEQRRIVAAQEPLVERICELRAVTREGMAARARSLMLWEGDDPSGDIDGSQVNERLLGAIVRDLLAGSAAA